MGRHVVHVGPVGELLVKTLVSGNQRKIDGYLFQIQKGTKKGAPLPLSDKFDPIQNTVIFSGDLRGKMAFSGPIESPDIRGVRVIHAICLAQTAPSFLVKPRPATTVFTPMHRSNRPGSIWINSSTSIPPTSQIPALGALCRAEMGLTGI